MNNEEKFKQSLKSLVESKEFVFDENEWDKAAAYIDKKRGGARAFRLSLLALLVAGIVTTSVFVLPSMSAAKKETSHVQAHSVSQNSPAPQQVANSTAPVISNSGSPATS